MVQQEAFRFDPKLDTKFGGCDAFFNTNSVVSDTAARKKFKTITKKNIFHDFVDIEQLVNSNQ